MRQVSTHPKFQCDFCKKRAVRHVMAIHEKRCFRNPDRFCDRCQNTGLFRERAAISKVEIGPELPCPYCAKFDAKRLAAIQAYEQRQGNAVEQDQASAMRQEPKTEGYEG